MNGHRSAFILALGMLLSATIFGLFFYSARQQERTIRVVGFATDQFEADVVKWSFNLSEVVPLNRLTAGYQSMSKKLTTFNQLWEAKAIGVDEMNVLPVSVRMNYDNRGNIVGHVLEQNIYLISKHVEAIEAIAINPMEFAEQNIAFEFSNLEYFSSRLDDIKKELLAKATQNAKERADEIVGATQSRIQKLLSASAGVFQITEPYSTEVAGYGIHSTRTRDKAIRVTVTAVFSLR